MQLLLPAAIWSLHVCEVLLLGVTKGMHLNNHHPHSSHTHPCQSYWGNSGGFASLLIPCVISLHVHKPSTNIVVTFQTVVHFDRYQNPMYAIHNSWFKDLYVRDMGQGHEICMATMAGATTGNKMLSIRQFHAYCGFYVSWNGVVSY